MSGVVFVPVPWDEAVRLRDSAAPNPVGLLGHAATPALMRAHDFDASMQEDAEFVALGYAAVRALLDPAAAGIRLVLAAEPGSAATEPTDEENGTVTVSGLAWRHVRALFADEPAAGPAVAAARREAAGRSLDELTSLPAVAALSEGYDLLWYAPEELETLADPD